MALASHRRARRHGSPCGMGDKQEKPMKAITSITHLLAATLIGAAAIRTSAAPSATAIPAGALPIAAASDAFVPEKDPPLEGPAPEFVAAARNVHPRLLFGPDDLPQLKAFYASERGRVFREAMEKYLPACIPPTHTEFLDGKDPDTDAQRQFFWRLPTVALHYVLTGDKASFDKAVGYMKVLVKLPHWQTTLDVDCGMGAATLMTGAGFALDWLWNDLDPVFREEFRQKCLYHARAMYYQGFLMKTRQIHYWQNDPANNHRWFSDAGMASCLLAAYSGAPEEQWLLARLKEEIDFVVKWLPEDGSSHEGPTYMIFGLPMLVLEAQMLDRCLGTGHLQSPYFKSLPRFMAQCLTPDRKHRFNYADSVAEIRSLGYELSAYACTSAHGLADEQAVLDGLVAANGAQWGWMGLLWCDARISGGQPARLPASAFFPDLGLLMARDGWSDDGVGVLFKCGPFGGYTLNRFRNAGGKDGQPGYINVAHDDPDANAFQIYAHNRFLAENDRYSKDKKSANHNTILINGIGQQSEGQPEGGPWSQPGGDMTKMGVITALKLTDGVDVVEGEASGSYLALPGKRPALERFRRALVFAKGGYVLVLDDIRALESVEISWLMQGADLQAVSEPDRSFSLVNGEASCPFRIETSRNDALKFNLVAAPADDYGKPLGFKQLRMVANTDRLRVASVYDVYHKELTLSFDSSDPQKLVVMVKGGDIDDCWEWSPTEQRLDTYSLSGARAGKSLIQVGPADRPRDPSAAKHTAMPAPPAPISPSVAAASAAPVEPASNVQMLPSPKLNPEKLRAAEVQGPAITAAAFGDRVFVPGQIFTFGDTWDTAWMADGRVLVQYNDGCGFSGNNRDEYHDGICELLGTPADLSRGGVNLNPGKLGSFLGQTYSTGLYELDGALYHLCCYSVQTPGAWEFGPNNLYKSVNGGASWLNQRGEIDTYIPNDQKEATFAFPDKRWAQINFVKYGQGGVAPDLDRAREFAYLNCGTFLARIRRADLSGWKGAFDRTRTEYYCGVDNADGTLDENWSRDSSRLTPVSRERIMSMVWNPGLRRYLATAVISDSWLKPPIPSTLMLFEAPHPWGPWTKIHQEFINPRVRDNLGWLYLSPAFTIPDGTMMWTTATGRDPYGLQFLPIYLSTRPVETRGASQAERFGTELSTAITGSSGAGYVDGFDAIGDSCSFTLPVASAGKHVLRYRYHCDVAGQSISLAVNDAPPMQLALGNTVQSTLPWNEGSVLLDLPAGPATIRFFVADEGQAQNHFHLDRIQLVWLRGEALKPVSVNP